MKIGEAPRSSASPARSISSASPPSSSSPPSPSPASPTTFPSVALFILVFKMRFPPPTAGSAAALLDLLRQRPICGAQSQSRASVVVVTGGDYQEGATVPCPELMMPVRLHALADQDAAMVDRLHAVVRLPPPRLHHRLPQGLARPRHRRPQLHHRGPRNYRKRHKHVSVKARNTSTPTTPASFTATSIAAASSSTATPAR
jgi:hypothetical protein